MFKLFLACVLLAGFFSQVLEFRPMAFFLWPLAGMLIRWGRRDASPLFLKEAMAVVGLSWVLATVLGAMPFYLSGTGRGPAVRLTPGSPVPQVLRSSGVWWQSWHSKQSLDTQQVAVIRALLDAGGRGLSAKDLQADANVTEAVPLLDRLAGDGL